MRISDISIDRPVFTAMVTVGVLVLGALALMRLGVDLFPNMSLGVATVVTPYPGAGPEETETLVTRPIEDAVSSINGVDAVRSTSRESFSTVIVQFKLETDIRQALSDVRDRVSMIRGALPQGVRDPIISRVDPGAVPVLTYGVSSPRSSLETRQFVDDVLRPALERVDGVGSVTVFGGAEREVRVELDRSKLEAVGLTVSQVSQGIGGESFDLPSGRVTVGTRELAVKSVGSFRSPEEVGKVVLASTPAGTQVRVRDVAAIVDGVKEARTQTRINGVDSVTFQVQKQAGTNTVAVVDGVSAALEDLASRIPGDIKVTVVADSSTFIRSNLRELQESLVVGGLLAVLVIFLFMLDWRSTLISALALPTSIIATFFIIWQLGFTLNLMTMMALSLAVGLLIDDSVVVRENIFRHMERGEDPVTAARKGTAEIALAVMATTFTIVAVFGPVAFTGGMVGRMFREFGLTVAAAVLVSLLVSLTVDPMLSARIVQQIATDHHERMRRHRVLGPIVRAYDGLDALYRSALVWALNHGKLVALGAGAAFVAALALTPLMGQEFFGQADQGAFDVNIELPPGTALSETDRIAREVEQIVRGVPEVQTVATTLGPDEEVNKATLQVVVTPKSARQRSLRQMMESLRPKLAAVPGLSYNLRESDPMGSSASTVKGAPVTIYVRGPDYATLASLAERTFELVRRTRAIRDAAISYHPGMPEQRLEVDRTRSGDLGVPYAAVATTLRTALEGDVVAKYRSGEHESDIRVRLQAGDRASVESLALLPVPSRTGRMVRIGEVTHIVEAPTPATIERLDRERQITITANVIGASLGEVVAGLEQQLGRMDKPAEYSFAFAGEAEMMGDASRNMGLALGLAVVFIYLVLASQFESLVHPFTIMLALPLAVVGALGSLFLADLPIGMPAMIGIILLMGLVTKNSILLVDYTNQLRARGLGIEEALLQAGPTRLRPILMTSAAMVLGMIPTAIGRGEGSEFRAPMSIAVIGGVVTSTVLTLVVVPVVYVWADKFRLRRKRAQGPEPAERAPECEPPRAATQ